MVKKPNKFESVMGGVDHNTPEGINCFKERVKQAEECKARKH